MLAFCRDNSRSCSTLTLALAGCSLLVACASYKSRADDDDETVSDSEKDGADGTDGEMIAGGVSGTAGSGGASGTMGVAGAAGTMGGAGLGGMTGRAADGGAAGAGLGPCTAPNRCDAGGGGTAGAGGNRPAPPPEEQGAVSVALPSPPLDEHPAWLVSQIFMKGYKQENNVEFESDDRGIRFNGSPRFTYDTKLGRNWSEAGTWRMIDQATVALTPTFGAAESINLSSALIANCRVLDRPGVGRLFTSRNMRCPFVEPLSAEACAIAGTYESSTESRVDSDNYYSSTTYTTTYELASDGFVRHQTSSFKTTCYGDMCKSLANRSAPRVGKWTSDGTNIQSDIGPISVAGFTFRRSTVPCVQ